MPVTVQNIVCLPDLLRGTRVFPEGFFDLVREPIRQACGIDIGFPPGGRKPHGLLPGFDLAAFRAIAGQDGTLSGPAWQATYHALPDAALEYLSGFLPEGTLILSFEMPPWLSELCIARKQGFIDIRPSPLRFGSDLYMAMRTNLPSLASRITPFQVSTEEQKLEAGYLAASVRMHQQRLAETGRYQFDLDNTLIYIGQAPYDASLLSPEKPAALTCDDYADTLRNLAKDRKVRYKPHPFAPDHATHEMQALTRILGKAIAPCHQNAYQILSSEDDVQLVGISSSLLQEAAWFGKTAQLLFRPYVPIDYAGPEDADAYQQIHFQTLLSPAFWHGLLAPERPAPLIGRVTPQAHHHARQLLDHWWDYGKVMTWEKSLPIESFERSGGFLLRSRVEALEQTMKSVQRQAAQAGNATWQQQILQTHARETQQFGRGDLYQGHDDWGLPGQRPTLLRIDTYGLKEWLSPQSSVLDIGCNIGMFGNALSEYFGNYLGFDNNPVLIEIAQDIAGSKGIGNCRFESWTFDTFLQQNHHATYDVVLSFAVHVWIGRPMQEYAACLWQLTAPQGVVIIESNNLATNNKNFFTDMQTFTDQGFQLLKQGMLKDDGIIDRGYCVFRKP